MYKITKITKNLTYKEMSVELIPAELIAADRLTKTGEGAFEDKPCLVAYFPNNSIEIGEQVHFSCLSASEFAIATDNADVDFTDTLITDIDDMVSVKIYTDPTDEITTKAIKWIRATGRRIGIMPSISHTTQTEYEGLNSAHTTGFNTATLKLGILREDNVADYNEMIPLAWVERVNFTNAQ